MDPIGWYIATMHGFFGHDKAAAMMGVPAGDKDECALCRYERTRTDEDRQAVIDAIGVGRG